MASRFRFVGAFLVAVAGAVALVHAPLTAVRSPSAQQTNAPRGQTATRLADGRWLVVGGEDGRRSAGAAIYDPASGRTTPVAGLAQPRAWHTATVLADGKVLVVGGQAGNQQPASAVEIFDPATQSFFQIAVPDTSTRSGHTATLLTDGRLLIAGGVGPDGARRRDAEVWSIDPTAAIPVTVSPLTSSLRTPRAYHRATLLADGRVLFDDAEGGGRGSAPEAFDSSASTFTPAEAERPDARVVLAESRPVDGAVEVAEDARITLRFSGPMATASAEAIALTGPNGAVPVRAVPAEGGRLLFLWPARVLDLEADYVLTMRGLTDERGVPLEVATLAFATRRDARRRDPVVRAPEEWVPDADSINTGWRTGRPDSPWQTLPPLEAAGGVTALAGQVLRLDGQPLPNVTLRVGARQTESDRTGRFLLPLPDVATGRIEMLIDGRTANRPRRPYGTFEVGVPMTAGRTTVLPYTVWMPLLDTSHTTRIPSLTTTEMVITTPRIPGLELHLPAGTVIRDDEGTVVRELTITPIPLDRPPFALPSIEVPVYFTIQPGGAYVHTYGSGAKGAWLVYPNGPKGWAGKRIPFFHYEPEEKGWYVYGVGTVTPNRAQVVPDASTRLYEFSGAMINMGWGPPADAEPPGDCCGNDGDPVNLTTGLFELEQTDLSLPDVLPIALTRTYRTRDLDVRPFGIGTTYPYAMFLWSAQQYQEADLVLPDGARIHYVRTSPGTGFIDAVFEHKESATTSATPTSFYKSTLTWNGAGWDLRAKNGMVYVFGENAPLQAIRDRYGNTIRLTWSLTNGSGSGYGNLLQVSTPHGRWIRFTYDGSNRIIEAKDPIGRTVGYTYDAQGRLWKVTDPLNQVTEYTYDTDHRMLTFKNRNGVVVVTNEYTTAADAPTPIGWVKKQTFADAGTTQFAYTVVNGKSTQTDVTDPSGGVRRTTFNSSGYTLSDTRAMGTTAAVTTSATRGANSFVASATDNEGHTTVSQRNALGNETSTTWLSGTANEITAIYDYHPTFNTVSLIGDALGHTTTTEYDAAGNVTGVMDGLNHRTSLDYSTSGDVTSVTNALQHTTTITYDRGDVRTVTDPLQRTRTFFTDAIGRVVRVDGPGGASTRFEYDGLDRRTKVIDPQAGETQFVYLPEGQLAQLIDAKSNIHTFAYNARGQLLTHSDPLGRVITNEYDIAGNLTSTTDRKGQATTYQYDQLNRVSQLTFDGGSTMTLEYGANGQVEEIVDSVSGTITRGYDDLGRLTSETSTLGTVTYGYDAASRLTSMTASGQPEVTYAYDNADRLTSITRGALTATMTYDDANRRTSLTLPNGIVSSYTYDDASQLTTITNSLGAVTLSTITYGYDLSGNRVSVNGVPVALPQPISGATYDAANQLTTWGPRQFSYDANGNTTSTGLTSYAWNSREQLVSISGQTSSSFTYDANGRRTGRTTDSDVRSFHYDGANVIGEYVSGSLAATVWSNLGADEYLARISGTTMEVPLTDGLGSVRHVTDALGAVNESLSYEPYGRMPSAMAPQYPYTYTSREAEVDGLMYYRARYYDPALGRFLSQDPLGLSAGVNAYAYAVNNPMSFTDPSGTSAKGARTIIEAVMGWIAGTLETTVFGPEHPVTNDLRQTPAMDTIRQKYRDANCASKRYCGDFNYRQFFTTANVVGHTIGAFCADLKNLGGGNVHVRAQNTWGLESGTRIPELYGNNRRNSSVEQILTGKGPLQYPKSFFENRQVAGMFQNVTLWFLWTEHLPCRCQ